MIISASYRTDIPTFYGKWFMNRLAAGYCLVANPYGGKPYRVSLLREHVDGIVFWTKNLGPFMDQLSEVRERGFPFMVQYTINGYPRTLEYSVVDSERSIQHMHALSSTFGKRVGVWRYDTIVFTEQTGFDWHLSNFRRLARNLEGTTDEVVISFVQLYQKTLRNMQWAEKEFKFNWFEPSEETKITLVGELVKIAKEYGMTLTTCSQKAYAVAGSQEAHCVDAKRLSDISGRPFSAKLKGNRPECGCYISRDIGAYDTCPHGCVYCYAVINRDRAQINYHEHDPESEFLFNPYLSAVSSSKPENDTETPRQLNLL